MNRSILFVSFFCSFSATAIAQNESPAAKSFETAENFRKKAQPDSAIFYYSKAAEIFIQTGEIQFLQAAYNQLGIIYTRQDKYDLAKLYLEKAWEAGQKVINPDNPDMATTHISLGVLYAAEKNYSLSLQHHFRSLAIRQHILGELHSDIATNYGNIGNVYLRNNQADSAIFFHQKAARIREKLFGEKSEEVTQSYIHLGHSFKAKKEYDKALPFYEKALANKILQRGKGHKDLARFYTNVSEIYHLMGKNELAEYYKILSREAIKE